MDDKLSYSQDLLIQALGRQSDFWGLGKAAGEIYAVLYLSSEPIPLEEIARKLKVTKGSISIAIRQLEQLGMVRRSRQKGDRRVFFESENNFWKIAHSLLGLRHKPEFEQTFALIEESVQVTEQGMPSPEKDIMQERLQSLQEFYRLLDGAVEVALSMHPDKLKTLLEMVKLFESNALDKNLTNKSQPN